MSGDPLEFLLSLERLGMKFGLEAMQRLCAALGHPERAFDSILIAGTNGKGSVTAMVHAALRAAGHDAARYTSPHLERLEERFVIGDEEVTRARLVDAAGRVQETVERLLADSALEATPTFFECTTAVAFELFRSAGVPLAVLEVGLGGRLDATNVVAPIATAITSIDLDHQAQLGDSLASVAREKAGIAKPGIPLVCGRVRPEAEAVVAAVCAEGGARLVRVADRVRQSARVEQGQTVASFHTARRSLEDVPLALPGQHQVDNAATALVLLEEVARQGYPVDDRATLQGLSGARWPGRLERWRYRDAEVLLDAAHNPAGARALADYLRSTRRTGATLVFGAMSDKDVAGMLGPLLPICGALVCTTAAGRRAMPAEAIAAIARRLEPSGTPVRAVADPALALEQACASASHVVAAGSIFLIGPLRGILATAAPP